MRLASYQGLTRLAHAPSQTIVNKLKDHKTSCGDGCPNLLSNYAALDQPLSNCLEAFFNVRPGLMVKALPP